MESDQAFQRLIKELPECDPKSGFGLEEQIERLERELIAKKIKPTLVLVPLASPLACLSKSSARFTPHWLMEPGPKRPPELMGEMGLCGRRIPVYGIWTAGDKNVGCVLQLPGCVQWQQFGPANEPVELDDIHGPFLIRFVDLANDEIARKRHIDADPEWLRAQPDKDRYLSLRVWLVVLERFKLTPINRELGLKFSFSAATT